ncbi:gastrula zinc finger protein xFG20-1-like [Ruditapes philippinarum]|uniref:gastrula zinc finger protein xFG20-1-like n=1 Tax=Ruditapes philippinarum TaxID=129788 RepID=UPI00295C0189|nr:gastrula zinc finger protein xFG20-1-like [Ruditapes philippinarum]
MEDYMRQDRYQAMDESFHYENTKLCTDCGKRFETGGGLRKHTLSKHDGNNNLKHVCSVCKKTFLEKHQLQSHMIQHGSEKFKCIMPNCDKQYSSKTALKRHVVHFHEKKSYSCSTCNIAYSDKHVLKDHVVAVHTHGCSHRCSNCGKGFKWRASLSRHMKKKHLT